MEKDEIMNTINKSDKKALIKDSISKAKEILSESKNQKQYNTGTMFEHIFASMWDKMPTQQLESHRKLLNKKIAERKIKSRILAKTK